MQHRNSGAAVSHAIEAEMLFGAAGERVVRGSTVGSSWLRTRRTMPQKPNSSSVWECNKNLHGSRQQVLIQRLALTSQTWTPILQLQFVLLTQAACHFKEAICLSKAGRFRSVFVVKYSNRRGKGNSNVSVKVSFLKKKK